MTVLVDQIVDSALAPSDYITVTFLLAVAAIVVDSFVRDWQGGWRPWHWDS